MEETVPETVFSPEEFSDELKMIGQTTKDFCENEVIPNISKLEKMEPAVSTKLVKVLS